MAKLSKLSTLLEAAPNYNWRTPEILEETRNGQTFKIFRRLLRISQAELAHAANCSQEFIALLESGDRLATKGKRKKFGSLLRGWDGRVQKHYQTR